MNSRSVVRSIRRVMSTLGAPPAERDDCDFSCIIDFPMRQDTAFDLVGFLKFQADSRTDWNEISK
ncbi:hypothetical protein JQ631_09140 [Bradyrhizobium manausense]|uniref:hypothetical protein n=1 Tax=Bradyrhizobium manausense TaxID=989370 RepID=UPI001BA6194F|nr:hypothetical protein [Bradyrhizobium manausense]MBR0789233.1 hypothetical protein [Bradyrhizobium manausense]